MLELTTNNEIIINGKSTGLGLAQTAKGSIVYTIERGGRGYKEHVMPRARYSAAHDAPASGAAGRAQLEADVLDLLENLGDKK